MNSEYEFEIRQRGIVVASGSGADGEAIANEAMRYARQYQEEGPLTLKLTGTHKMPGPPVGIDA